MRMVAPRIQGMPEITIAEDQPEYLTITAGVWHNSEDGSSGLLLRFKPSADERVRLFKGEDLFVTLVTFGQPMQPISVEVGPDGWKPTEDPK